MSSIIKIKNQAFSLPVIEITDFQITHILDELKRRIAVSEESEQMLPCVLSLQVQEVQPTFLAQLVEALRQVNLQAVGLQTENQLLAEQASYAGLAVFNERLNQYDLFHPLSDESKSSSEPHEMIHQGNVVAGEQLYAEGKDLIVLGDVKPGAEVIADGNIYIGGSLQGKAFAANAGSMNIDQVSIRAYSFEPELISISGFYQLEEDIPTRYKGLAVTVHFVDQKMHYELD